MAPRTLPLLAAALVPCVLAMASPPANADAVDDLIKAEMQKRHVPGLSLAVLHKGKVVKVAAYGLANVELNVPATPQTLFQIQSITKTFTAAGILLLMQDGKLALSDPVGKHLEGTPPAWKDITIRHLLTHTSGIKDFINEPTASLRLDVSEEDVLRATAPRPLNFPPGQRYAYSNSNYHLLAMIIRKHTRKSYGEFLKQRIFIPLSMNDTRIVSHSAIIPNRASGYLWRNNTLMNGDFVAESILSYGGGGIITTASDMAKWAAAFDSEQLLKKATIEQAWGPARLNDGKTSGYGLGWAIATQDGHRAISHTGGHVTGFTSALTIFPEDKMAIVVLTNSNNFPPGLTRKIAGIYDVSLAPKSPRPIEDKEPQVTAMLGDCIAHAADWTLDEKKFTPELWKDTMNSRLAVQMTLKVLGPLKSLELLNRTETNGMRSYRYRAIFANGTLAVTMSLDKEGKMAELSIGEE